MSLKYFHIVFVIAATLLCFGFSVWCFVSPDAPDTLVYRVGGVAGIIAGFSAIFYGIWVWKKLKRLPLG